MRRISYVLAALLYLLPQVGAWAHGEDAAEACGECPASPAGPIVECNDQDCGDPEHHHHSQHHHPGTCRICSSAAQVFVSEAALPEALAARPFESCFSRPRTEPAVLPLRPIRGPPGACPSQG